MKKFLTILFCLLCISIYAEDMTIALLQPRVAEGSETCLPIELNMVRGELRNAFGRESNYKILTRQEVDALLKEHDFQRSGLVDDTQRKQIGIMTGAQYICVSTITKYKTQLYVEAYLVNIETGQMTNPATRYVNIKDEDYSLLQGPCNELAREMLGEIGGTEHKRVTPSKPEQDYQEMLAEAEAREQQEQERLEQERLAEERRIAEENARKQAAINKANQMGALFGQTHSPEGAGGTGAMASSAAKGNPLGHGNSGGNSWSLNGRSIVGALPAPSDDFKQEGRVVVHITVDKEGRVISAVVAPGSTISDYATQQLAIKAALKAKFNVVDGPNETSGTITYNFKFK